ncbi:hypothetical protein B0H14DRAFT_3902936 [Mycena olivaceomarginata]|nr:hypothetical protein B0H14DRAFT_3902936 [Mycena olivaceomarginata]
MLSTAAPDVDDFRHPAVVNVATVADDDEQHPELAAAFLILLFSSPSLLSCFFLVVLFTDVVLSHPIPLHIAAACTPVAPSRPPERHVRDAPQLPGLSAARAGLLQLPTRNDVFSDCEATPRCPDVLPRPCPQHQAPVHSRYETQQALPFLHARAALIDPTDAKTIFSASIPHPICRFPRVCPRWSLRYCPTLPSTPAPLDAHTWAHIHHSTYPSR